MHKRNLGTVTSDTSSSFVHTLLQIEVLLITHPSHGNEIYSSRNNHFMEGYLKKRRLNYQNKSLEKNAQHESHDQGHPVASWSGT